MRVAERLESNRIADSRLEAEVLVRHALGMDRAEFFVALDRGLTDRQSCGIDELAQRRLDGDPLAYILGHREFYGLGFAVNSSVLVPRQETELLVDKVLAFGATREPGECLEVADVGTGSGAIAIAIACNLPGAVLYATDASRDALAVADINRRAHGVADRVHLSHGDLLEALSGPVDVVVSNPPYIRSGDIEGLAQDVRREPAAALDGGADGLELVGRLIRQAPAYVRPGGRLIVEIAPEQLGWVCQLARDIFKGSRVSFDTDLQGQPRAVCVKVDGGAV